MVRDLLVADLRGSGQYRSVSGRFHQRARRLIVRGHLIAMYGVDKPELVARFSLN